MPDGDHSFHIDSPQEAAPFEIYGGDLLKKITEEHPPSIPLSVPLSDAGVRSQNKKIPTPLYGAGFFLGGAWFREVYLPRVNLDDRNDVLYMLRGDKEVHKILHRTTRIIYYHDHADCAFVCLLCNFGRSGRDAWFSRRNEVLDGVCKTMQLTETETAKAKGAFQWHMFDPPCYATISKEFVVGI